MKKIAIVTGAGSGVGKRTALTFAEEGKIVVVVGRSQANTTETAEEVSKLAEVFPIIADIGTEEGVDKVVSEVVKKYGRIDILAHCAARFQEGVEFAKTDIALFDDVMRINARGTFLLMKAVLGQMEKQRSGVIVNVSSHDGLKSDPFHSAYVASKHAAIGLTKNAAVEYGPKGIRVCAVCPGVINTKMIANIMDLLTPEVCGPMRRPAEPQEIADMVCYLASDKASYLNGLIMVADGGMSA